MTPILGRVDNDKNPLLPQRASSQSYSLLTEPN